MSVGGLIEVLRGAGFDAHADHLLDALWLCSLGCDLTTFRAPTTGPAAPTPPGRDGDRPPTTRNGDQADGHGHADVGTEEHRDGPASRPPNGTTLPVYDHGEVAAEDVTVRGAAIVLPAARALPDRLALIRALRPFRLPFASRQSDLDEARTAELTAEMRVSREDGFFPVLQPRSERWYEAHLVVEDDPAIELWAAPLRELSQLLRDAGAFRLVRSWRLRLDASAPSSIGKARLESPAGGLTTPGSLGRARQLIVFASHGRSARWADGAYARLIRSWSEGSVVLLHLQPRDRWRRTGLGEPRALAHSRQPGSSNAALDVGTFRRRPEFDASGPQVVKLPAIAIEPVALETWARTLMGMGRTAETFLLDLDDAWAGDAGADGTAETPVFQTRDAQKDVRRALSTLHERSPAAYDLAIMLASAPFTLPVARLVQEVTRHIDPAFTVLADLMLSGIVVPRSPNGTVARESTYFEVSALARRDLLGSLRDAEARELARALDERISEHLSRITGRSLQFSALIAHPEGRAKLPTWAQEFAHIASALDGREGVPAPRRAWQNVLGALDDAVVGRMARLASTRIALDAQTVDERLWPAVDDPSLVRPDEDGHPRFVPAVADFLQGRLTQARYLGLTVLWVDDVPRNNAYVVSILEGGRANVIQVLDTDQALAHPQLPTCDLVISDMARHGNDRAGFKLMRILRARDFSAPILIFAAYTGATAARRRAVIKAGAFGATNRVDEILALIDRAAVAAVLRRGSTARKAIEAEILAPLSTGGRDISAIPDGEFCTQEEIHRSLVGSGYLAASDDVVGTLLILETGRQRSWLIATAGQLLFILDDAKARAAGRLCQRTSPLSACRVVTTSVNDRGAAVVRIGDQNRFGWFYSPELFPGAGALETAILDLVRRGEARLPHDPG